MYYLYAMKVDTSDLKTIKNYAVKHGITASYIYKLVKENQKVGWLNFLDGVV